MRSWLAPRAPRAKDVRIQNTEYGIRAVPAACCLGAGRVTESRVTPPRCAPGGPVFDDFLQLNDHRLREVGLPLR